MNTSDVQKMMMKCIRNKANTNTKKKYQTALNNLQYYIQQKNNLENTDEHITRITNDNARIFMLDYQAYLKGNDIVQPKNILCDNTINQYMVLVQTFLEDYCKITFKKHVKQLKVAKKQPRYLTTDRVNKILLYIEMQRQMTTNKKSRNRTLDIAKVIIKLLFGTGLRIHEALNLEVADITKLEMDKHSNYQLNIIGKGTKTRTIIITSCVYNELFEHIKKYCNGKKYIFQSVRTDKPMSTYTIERYFNDLAKELDTYYNITDKKQSYSYLLKPHNLRHSYAVNNMSRGVPINAMQKLLGHSSITTTQIYTDLLSDSLSEAIAKVEQQEI
ncbi:MAG: tyrosine-type recombinase/integrase [Methanosphaera sp.]|nr:tyrosine-type recombinase/integrase [Methanosphaera sp.]